MPARFLLITASHTGNNIFCTPAIRLLRKHMPEAIIDAVALNKLSAEVFAGNPDINHLRVTDNMHVLRRLSRNYDKVFCLNYKSAEYLHDVAVPLAIIPPLQHGLHHAEQALQFMACELGVQLQDEDRAYVIAGDEQAAVEFRRQYKVRDDDVLVCIHLGCGRTSIHGWKFFYKDRARHQKLWPIEAYMELGDALVRANPRIRIVITGTSNEAFLGRQYEKHVPNTINLIGKTTVASLYSIMQQFDLFVSQDCGVMHIAAASGVIMVGLFGPTEPDHTGPYPLSAHHTIIKKSSMEDIQVKEVLFHALEILALRYPHTIIPLRTNLELAAQRQCALVR